jgi:ectoine hydroxylase-related dioxygenase (phytanoyl-CoA dioxygenase family)
MAQYLTDGYVILPDLFTPEEMDDLAARIDRFDTAYNAALQASRRENSNQVPDEIVFSYYLNFKDPAIQAFIADPRWVSLSTQILGPDVKLYWDQSVYKRPEAKRDFPWHQDNGYVPITPEHYLTCWLALNDATIENGCIWVRPGSHRNGVVEHKPTPVGLQCYFGPDPGIPVPLRKGSLVAFCSMLMHRSGPNQSAGMRKGYVIQYSVDGAYNPTDGRVFDNGPVIARGSRPAYAGFVSHPDHSGLTG